MYEMGVIWAKLKNCKRRPVGGGLMEVYDFFKKYISKMEIVEIKHLSVLISKKIKSLSYISPNGIETWKTK